MALDAASALSGNSLATLRRDAAAAPKDEATLRRVASQFEALMTQQILKSSRATALGEDLMGGAGLDTYKDMFDQQMAQQISSGKGLGLADVLVQQLRGAPLSPARGTEETSGTAQLVSLYRLRESNWPAENWPKPVLSKPIAGEGIADHTDTTLTNRISSFVKNIWQQAEKAAQSLGLPTEAVVGHAALETGWGAHRPGGDSHNLFGIKAGKSWQGGVVNASTLEMDGGKTRTEQAQFRRYDNADDGMADYVRLLKTNPRYAEALKTGSAQHFADGLQKAGYATDPQYAAKLKAAISSAAAAKKAI